MAGFLETLDRLLGVALDSTNSAVMDGGSPYAVVPVSTAAQAVGDANDCLVSIRYRAGAVPADVVILDGVIEITRIKAASQTVNTDDVVYFGWVATTGWHITTGAGTSVVVAYNARP